MKTCTKCKKQKKEFWANQNWCKECFSEYHKKAYKKNKAKHLEKQKQYRKTKTYKIKHRKDSRLNYKRNKEKVICRAKLNYAISTGKIEKKPCQVCGVLKTEAHHDDYAKPLEVKWFCTKHHREYEANKNLEN